MGCGISRECSVVFDKHCRIKNSNPCQLLMNARFFLYIKRFQSVELSPFEWRLVTFLSSTCLHLNGTWNVFCILGTLYAVYTGMWSKTGLDGYHSPCYQLPHNKKEGRVLYTAGIQMNARTEIHFIEIIS